MIDLTSIKMSKKSCINLPSEMLIVGFFEGGQLNSMYKKLNKRFDDAIIKSMKIDGFSGKKDSQLMLYGDNIVKRFLLIGLGPKKEYSTDWVRSLSAKITRLVDKMNILSISLDGESFGLKKNNMAQAFSEGLILGSYKFNEYKTNLENKDFLKNIIICGELHKQSIEKGKVLGESVCFARDLGNHPANILTPTYLSHETKKIVMSSSRMSCTIFDNKDLKKMGMGAFYGVARGAKEPAKLIIVEYKGGNKIEKPIALVGKGLTFDSGGISIKPSMKMDEMKFDMCGSATVLGALKAVSILKPNLNIIFAIGSTENMPGGDAQRPGDIVKAYNGKTIEVLNTDAEGRLVLADVLAYINKKYSPNAILDFATLTGAVLIALGNRASGIMGNDEKLINRVKQASILSNEKVWELPLWQEYSSEIKGLYADIKNMGESRLAGTIAGAAFLKEFVEDTPWVHMDIAGTAWGPKEPEYQPKIGATGVAVRLVYSLLENWKNN